MDIARTGLPSVVNHRIHKFHHRAAVLSMVSIDMDLASAWRRVSQRSAATLKDRQKPDPALGCLKRLADLAPFPQARLG
jgi:hypothetical protein